MKRLADKIIRTGAIPTHLELLTDDEFDELMLHLWSAYHIKERDYHNIRADRRVKEGIGNYLRDRDL